MNKPKRPCGIYNLFYQLERELLIQQPNSVFDPLHQLNKAPINYDKRGNRGFIPIPEADDADQRPPRYRHLVLASDWFKSGRRVRRHCKSKDNLPGNLGFEGLNKVISEKWKTVDEETKRYLKVISDQEWELYRKEIKVYNKIQDELAKIMMAKTGEAKVEESKIPLTITKRQSNKTYSSKETPTVESIPLNVAGNCKKQSTSQVHTPCGVSSVSVLCGECPPTPPGSSLVHPKEVSSSNSNVVCSFIPLKELDEGYSFRQPRGGIGRNDFGTTRYVPWPRRKMESCGDRSGLRQITTLSSHRHFANTDTHFLTQIRAKTIRAQVEITHCGNQYQNQHKWIHSKILNPTILDHTVQNPNLISYLDDSVSMFSTSGSVLPKTHCRPITVYSHNNGILQDQTTIQSESNHIISDNGGSEQYEDDFPSFHPVCDDVSLRLTSSERLECLSQMDNRIDGLLHDYSESEQSASLFYHASR